MPSLRCSSNLATAKFKVGGETMKTQGEIECAISEAISRFEQDYMGRGPKEIHAHLIGDLVVVRLIGVLTVAEQQLVKTLPPEKGRDLLKQVRTHLVETARPLLEATVQGVTGVKVVSLHHDISTATGEQVILFTLAEPPLFRETRGRSLARQVLVDQLRWTAVPPGSCPRGTSHRLVVVQGGRWHAGHVPRESAPSRSQCNGGG